MSDKRLDLTGEICPIPLLITQQEMTQLEHNDKLILEIDSTHTVRNILKWCEDNEHAFEVDESTQGTWIISIVK